MWILPRPRNPALRPKPRGGIGGPGRRTVSSFSPLLPASSRCSRCTDSLPLPCPRPCRRPRRSSTCPSTSIVSCCARECESPPPLAPRPKRTEAGTSEREPIEPARPSTAASAAGLPASSSSSSSMSGPSARRNVLRLARRSCQFARGGGALCGSASAALSPVASLSSSCSSSPTSAFSRGFHSPRIMLAPSPHRLRSPPTPLFVTAKKYSFGYPWAWIRCNLRVFGAENRRSHEVRWHAN